MPQIQILGLRNAGFLKSRSGRKSVICRKTVRPISIGYFLDIFQTEMSEVPKWFQIDYSHFFLQLDGIKIVTTFSKANNRTVVTHNLLLARGFLQAIYNYMAYVLSEEKGNLIEKGHFVPRPMIWDI